MPNISTTMALKMMAQGLKNLMDRLPIAISFEITHSCNCNCGHCDKGGKIPGEKLAPAWRFVELARELRPLFAQISGGEPLLRSDVHEIIQAMRALGELPYIVLCTNGWLLTEELYLALRRSGVNEFSISLDFPDERHDRNRGIPGLYAHLDTLIPLLTGHGHNDITVISVIRMDTLEDLPALAECAIRWHAAINFTAYTPLRTGDYSQSIRGADHLMRLREQIDTLIQIKRRTGRIFTQESNLYRYFDFFANNSYLPHCRAGYRSMVINPDGKMAPCAMAGESYDTGEELREKFCEHNTCGGCMVSLRANTEKSLQALLNDSWRVFLQLRNNSGSN